MVKPIIKLENIQYRYTENQESLVLNGVYLTVNKGEWVTIIGPNGSGKSTLTKVINGLVIPNNGQVTIRGVEMTEDNLWEVRKKIGMVFQNPENQFVGATVEDDVAFGLENLGMPLADMKELVKEALQKVGMWELRDREPALLSGGQKQRVAIAGIIATRPDILILDEATSMLDPYARQEVFKTIKELKAQEDLTVLSITHDISEALESNRIVVMDNGKIVDVGTPEEIFSYGEKLIDLGLELPFSERLKASLNKVGFSLPEEYMSNERMMEWLWTYYSKM